MRPRLFEDLVGSARVRPRSRSARTLPISVLLHVAALAAVVVLPLLAQEPLPPVAPTVIRDVVPAQIAVVKPPPGRPQGKPATTQGPPRPPRPAATPPTFVVPTEIPEGPPIPDDFLDVGGGCRGEGCIDGGLLIDTGSDWKPLVPVPDQSTDTPIVLKGTTIEPPRKLRHVDPIYPELAVKTHVQGVVVLDCTINPRGQVVNVQVVSGSPLLSPAAVDAVSQWRYSSTLLHGAPVPVVLTVEVSFILE
jgi:TonB family protein